MASKPHLLLVGGGHASVALLKRAQAWTRRQGATVTLLSEHPTLYYSGMVPEYLGGVYAADEVQIDLEAWCDQAGVRWLRGQATALDPADRVVRTAQGRAVDYDLVVFDVGARTAGVTDDTPGVHVKPLHHVERVERFVRRAVNAAPGDQPDARSRLAIVGGGAAGTEVALNVSARAQAADSASLDLTLIERGPSLLPGFPAGMQQRATRLLQRRGVEVRQGTAVKAAEDGALRLSDGTTWASDLTMWATGATGQPLFRDAGLPCDARGFLRVAPSLQCPSAPRVFAAGDCALVAGHEDLARVGVHAIKQGPLLADNVERALEALRAGRPPADARYRSFRPYPVAPLILSTGRAEGLWTAGPLWLRGRWALRLKHAADLRWMNRYRLRDANRWSMRQTLHARAAATT
jgi:NADH dehydrogenase FAD-containing subunit